MARRAITLLELLAVVAIVGVIIIALSPLINSTREQARRHMCAENLRLLETTIFYFVMDATWLVGHLRNVVVDCLNSILLAERRL